MGRGWGVAGVMCGRGCWVVEGGLARGLGGSFSIVILLSSGS